MPNEEDPKITARNARKDPLTEKLLRQFLKLESGTDAKAYQVGYLRAFGEKTGEHSGLYDETCADRCDDEHCWCRR